MEDKLKVNFIRSLSNYSICIEPYLRNIHEKYVVAYYAADTEDVDLKSYCKRELNEVLDAKKLLEQRVARK